MNNSQIQNRNFEAIAWGALFVWWGITELVNFLPDGFGALGVGVILLGTNAARSLNGIPTSSFSTTLGILALVWGGLELAGSVLNLPFELPIFPILLITLGVLILGREVIRMKSE
jgi:hypothetical protein